MKEKATHTKKQAKRVSVNRFVGWGALDDWNSEAFKLVYTVEADWQWQWPGWGWVAERVNAEFENNRTPKACEMKYRRILLGNAELRNRARKENDEQ